jgi:hypothetical protein
MSDVNEVFRLLDRWKHHPNYQLERRADIFFAVYLRAVLKKYVGATREVVIPEFPVKQDNHNLSDKVDYMALSEDGQVMMLVELKQSYRSSARADQVPDSGRGRPEARGHPIWSQGCHERFALQEVCKPAVRS